MKIKHWLLLTTTAIALSSTGALATQQPVQAASWHSGTPVALRGTYQYKKASPAEGFGAIFKVLPTSLYDSVSNNPVIHIIHTKYRKVGHYYFVKGHGVKSGFYLGGAEEKVMYRRGHYLRVADIHYYKTHGFKHLPYAKKTNHPKFD